MGPQIIFFKVDIDMHICKGQVGLREWKPERKGKEEQEKGLH